MPTQTMAQYTEAERCVHMAKAEEILRGGEMRFLDNEVYTAVYRGVQFIRYEGLWCGFILFKKGEIWVQWWDNTHPHYNPNFPKPFSDISRVNAIQQINWTRFILQN